MARELERGADREDDDRVRIARQRQHGEGRQGKDEATQAQQHAAEEPSEESQGPRCLRRGGSCRHRQLGQLPIPPPGRCLQPTALDQPGAGLAHAWLPPRSAARQLLKVGGAVAMGHRVTYGAEDLPPRGVAAALGKCRENRTSYSARSTGRGSGAGRAITCSPRTRAFNRPRSSGSRLIMWV